MGSTMTDRELDAAIAEKVLDLEIIVGDGEWWDADEYRSTVGEVYARRFPHSPPARLPQYFLDVAADYTVLVKVRETWDEERLRLFADALWRMWYDRAAEDVEDSRSMDSLPYAEYRVGDYSRAAIAALDNGRG